MTAYIVPADTTTVTATPDGLVEFAWKAGTVTPASDLEAQILADLCLTGAASIAPDKPTKTKTPATGETE